MTFFMDFLTAFGEILLVLFYPLLALLGALVYDPEVQAVAICIVASVVYLILCVVITTLGWQHQDIIASCCKIRQYRLTGFGKFWHFVTKLLLAVIHAAIYIAVWFGDAFGLAAHPHPVVCITCIVSTLGILVLATCLGSHDIDKEPKNWSHTVGWTY